jgi:hypothetical protein
MTAQLRDQNRPKCQSPSLKRIWNCNPWFTMMQWSSR